MVGFRNLPRELVCNILKLVLPEDLENFARITDDVTILSQPFLEEHERLTGLYKNPSLMPPNEGNRGDEFLVGPVPTLFKTVINQPRIGHYIEELRLVTLLSHHDKVALSEAARALYKQQKDLIYTAFADNDAKFVEWFYNVEKVQYLNYGDEDLLIGLLLPLLPNLKSLSARWCPDLAYFSHTIRQCTLDATPWLANLARVRLDKADGPRRLLLDDLRLFGSIPTLKSLTAFNIDDGVGRIEKYVPPQDSHITELELFKTDILAQPLYWYLESFRGLEKFAFEYVNRRNLGSQGAPFDPCWISLALFARAKATLQSLTILGPRPTRPPHGFIGSLQAFEALRELHIELKLLFPSEPGFNTWPSRVLPASLRILRLCDPSHPTPARYMRLFSGLKRAKRNVCLHLEMVECMTSFHDPLIELGLFCRLLGMSLHATVRDVVTWRGSWTSRNLYLTFGAEG